MEKYPVPHAVHEDAPATRAESFQSDQICWVCPNSDASGAKAIRADNHRLIHTRTKHSLCRFPPLSGGHRDFNNKYCIDSDFYRLKKAINFSYAIAFTQPIWLNFYLS